MRNFFIVVCFIGIGCNHITAQTLKEYDSLLIESNQVIFVLTKTWDAIDGMMFLYERENNKSDWICIRSFPVTVGRSGLAWDEESALQKINQKKIKKEGDGNAPAGIFSLGPVFGYKKMDGLKMPFVQMDEQDLCVDDVQSKYYNQLVHEDTIQQKDYISFENMKRKDALYEIGVWVNYNSFHPISGNGSCIFLHIWRNELSPTSGCTAMSKENMECLVYWLDTEKNPVLFQMCFKEEY